MEAFIKEEPLEYDALLLRDEAPTMTSSNQNRKQPSLIETQYESEKVYLQNIHNVLGPSNDDYNEYLSDFNSFHQITDNMCMKPFERLSKSNKLIHEDEAKKLVCKSRQKPETGKTKYSKIQEQMHEQKRRILSMLVESAKEKKLDLLMAAHNQHEPLTQNDEARIISSLSRKIEAIEADQQQMLPPHENLFAYRRLRRKLELRKLKRKKHLKLFDIDSYVNELIDREKDGIKQRLNTDGHTENEAILFETDEAIKSSLDMNENSDCEIVAIKRVLDRFKFKNFLKPAQCDFNYKHVITMPIGLVEKRNDDVKCVLSPFTNKVLKPYVRRDFESLPDKLLLNSEIIHKTNQVKFDRHSIDYVHLRWFELYFWEKFSHINWFSLLDPNMCFK